MAGSARIAPGLFGEAQCCASTAPGELPAPVPTRRASASDLARLRGILQTIHRAKQPQLEKHTIDLFGLRELRGPTARRLLIEILGHPAPAIQEPAAYQLAWLHDLQAVEPLLHVLQDHQRHARVRGQAAEAIGVILGHGDRRTIVMRRSAAVLVAALDDESPVVRFWACYSLGSMRARSALRALRRIAHDDRTLCPGWWRVGEEAQDAITIINGGQPPQRERIGEDYPIATTAR